ncbi:alpha/beta-hydrolase, partial [Martensiomyces pterosporus]
SQDNIVKYARYAGAAYKLEGPSWDCESNCQSQDTKGTIVDYYWDNIVYPSTGFVAHKDDTKEIIVSFRGSTVLFDWLADAQLLTLNWPESVPGSKVHSGFLAAFNSASDKIKSTIETILKQHPDYSIVITGHSLGGSEASIAAADFAVTHPEWKSKMALYTYGQPRTGNDVYANWLSSQPFPIYRATYKGDVVPQVPFRAMGFQHHGQE